MPSPDDEDAEIAHFLLEAAEGPSQNGDDFSQAVAGQRGLAAGRQVRELSRRLAALEEAAREFETAATQPAVVVNPRAVERLRPIRGEVESFDVDECSQRLMALINFNDPALTNTERLMLIIELVTDLDENLRRGGELPLLWRVRAQGGGGFPAADCPCQHESVGPCDEQCSCVRHASSHGCARCATYGSIGQRTEKARWLAEVIDTALEDLSYTGTLRRGETEKESAPVERRTWHEQLLDENDE